MMRGQGLGEGCQQLEHLLQQGLLSSCQFTNGHLILSSAFYQGFSPLVHGLPGVVIHQDSPKHQPESGPQWGL